MTPCNHGPCEECLDIVADESYLIDREMWTPKTGPPPLPPGWHDFGPVPLCNTPEVDLEPVPSVAASLECSIP